MDVINLSNVAIDKCGLQIGFN